MFVCPNFSSVLSANTHLMFNFQIDSQEENFCLLEYLSSLVNMDFPFYLPWGIWIHFSHEEKIQIYYFDLTIISPIRIWAMFIFGTAQMILALRVSWSHWQIKSLVDKESQNSILQKFDPNFCQGVIRQGDGRGPSAGGYLQWTPR